MEDKNQRGHCCATSGTVQNCCCKNRRTKLLFLAATTISLVLVGVLLTVAMLGNNNNDDDIALGKNAARGSIQNSEAYYKERFSVFRTAAEQLSSPSSFAQFTTPQSLALDWMLHQDSTVSHSPLEQMQFEQRYSMLVLFYACGGEDWQGFEESRLDEQIAVPTCQWNGADFLRCNDDNVIVYLNMTNRQLVGQLPDEIQHFSSLNTLDLSDNFIEGTLPATIFDAMKNLSACVHVCVRCFV